MIAELSANSSANNGGFWLLDGSKEGAAGNNVSFRSNGTTTNAVDSAVVPPLTVVVSGIGDISGDRSLIRLNGVLDETGTSEQGSGNYGNYSIFIGSRAGSSLRLNGIIYTLIVRGATTPTSTIADFERNLLARRCGVTF
jgi:hypothetical protein